MNPSLNNHPFNSTDLILESLAEFKNIKWDNRTLNDVENEYKKRFISFPTYLTKVQKGTILFRARKNEGAYQSPFKCLKDIGIIPKEYVTSFGRANIPNNPIFYCSSNEETVVREITQWYINDNGRAQDFFTKGVISSGWSPFTSFMTISSWLVTEDLNLALLFGCEENRSTEINECAKDRYSLKGDETLNFNNSKNLILDFFSNEFGRLDIKHHHEYAYSAMYAFNVMNNRLNLETSTPKFDGVKYASIANDYRGENFAISADAYKNKLQFLGANYCYTCNNNNSTADTDSNVLIGRDKVGYLNNNGTFSWPDWESTYDCDYFVKLNGKIELLKLENIHNSFSKPVLKIT